MEREVATERPTGAVKEISEVGPGPMLKDMVPF